MTVSRDDSLQELFAYFKAMWEAGAYALMTAVQITGQSATRMDCELLNDISGSPD